jgi:2,4-diketo-3-deoxy-L-fuconate hydrolase
MNIIRFGPKGEEKPGLLKKDRIVNLRRIFPDIPDIGESFFRAGWLKKISTISDPGEKLDVRQGCPVHRPSKIICLGINYMEHKTESGLDVPTRPLLFCKTPNTQNGPFDPIVLPRGSGKIDWEVELAVIIGKEGKRIQKSDTLKHIAGFTVLNDVSGREAQFSDAQWFRGKSFDTFAPMGPALVTVDEIVNPQHLRLTAAVDEVLMQDGNTKDMIFDIPSIIEYVSEDITLLPGDVISTGTPSGVGIFQDPPFLLKPGNVVKCHIEGVGTIINPVMAG